MTVSYSDVQALRQKRDESRPDRAAAMQAYLHRLDRIRQSLTDLVGSEGWQLHQTHLTGHRSVAQDELDVVCERMVRGPESGDALMVLKLRAAYLAGQVDILTVALGDAAEIIGQTTSDRESA